MHPMNDLSSRKLIRWSFAAMVVVFLLVLMASQVFNTQLEGLQPSLAQRLDSGWSYLQDGELHALNKLPESLNMNDTNLTLHHAMTPEMQGDQEVLALHTFYTAVTVWADDHLLYTSPPEQAKVPSACWHFVPMSNCQDATSLTLRLDSYQGYDTFLLGAPLLDTAGTIQFTLMYENRGVILFGIICFLLTLVLLICAALLRSWHSPASLQMLPLAAFVFLSGLWVLLDAQVFAMYGGNIALQYFLGYAAFFLLPAPYLLYVRLVTSDFHRSLTVLLFATLANVVLALILRMTGMLPLIEISLLIVHTLIIAAIIVSTLAFWRTVVQRREKQLRVTFIGMIIIYICVLVSLVFFYRGLFVTTNTSVLYTLGLSILLLCMAFDAIALFGRLRRQKDVVEGYRRLALEDSMTSLSNRNAFQLHWSALLAQPPAALAIVVFDVDNLKQINDRLGHQSGDDAIDVAAHLIRTEFESIGSCYRTGGDEFEVFVEGNGISQIPAALARFDLEIAGSWNDDLPSGGVSYGWASATFDAAHPLTEEALVRLRAEADHSLYHQKQKRKQCEDV